LPASFPGTIFVVVHSPESVPTALPEILERQAHLQVAAARDGEPIDRLGIRVAPPGVHLTLEDGHSRLVAGPRENGHRPAIDVLFRSAARAYGQRVTAVILSGALDDGASGMRMVKSAGGLCLVQEPDEALHKGMPQSAIEGDNPDAVLAAEDIARAIIEASLGNGSEVVIRGGASDMGHGTDEDGDEAERLVHGDDITEMDERFGGPTGLTCPECGGALWQLGPVESDRFGCHVGHRYSPATLEAMQGLAVESALWTAVRALEERSEVARRLAEFAEQRGHERSSARFRERVDDAVKQAEQVRQVARTLSSFVYDGPV
jgi:two-component system, chemotaxis family, protein-glutamate methylesterase/glutaminase